MLRVENLTRHYGSFCAVDQVSFELGKGEVIGLLGHNGAGKTTIMKIISGYMEADGGSVEFDGVPLAGNEKRIQRVLGYLPESLPVYPEMSVAEYLDYCANLKGLTEREKKQEIRRVVEATQLQAKFLSPISALSRGYKQRVGVAQAVLGKPKLLILDEPTNGLDPEQTAHMRALIKDVSKDATVILSTHIMQEVEALCSHVLILRSGQLVVDDALAALKQSHEIDLVCSAGVNDSAFLAQLSGVESVQPVSGAAVGHAYRLCCTTSENIWQLSAQLASQCQEKGHQIYKLAPVETDLEKLFFDSTQKEVPENAA